MRNFRKIINKQLGEILIERGMITRAQLEEAVKVQKDQNMLFGEIII